MNAPIFYLGGSKGGVGKSKLSFALIDYLCDAAKGVLLIESDTANPDVYKAHLPHASDSLVCREANLDTSDGWIELVNAADEFPHHCMVINSAARSGPGIEKYGMTLRETLGYQKHFRVEHGKNEFATKYSHINGIESFWAFAKTRLVRFRGLHKHTFYFHLKECEFRFNHRHEDIYKMILKMLRDFPLS